MIKLPVQKKNNKISLEKTKDIDLSIQFSLDGFSFCISDTTTKKDIYFTSFQFDETLNSPEELLNKIESIFKKDTNLQHEFTSIIAIHENGLASLVPNKYFDETLLEQYLNLNIKTLKTDFITYDDLQLTEAKNVYIPYVNINNYLFQNFGEFEYKHHKTVLLEKLLTIKKNVEKVMYINVSKNTFDIVILENQNILFNNSFTYYTKEDFIYFILFTAEQLNLDTEKFQCYFIGDITSASEIYKIAYKYIKNISFLESKNSIFKDLEMENHTNYILLGS